MKKYWKPTSEQDARWGEKSFYEGREEMAKKYISHSGGVFLDIGCGCGGICRIMAKKCDKVIGIDIAPEQIEMAKKKAAAENIEYLVGSGEDLSGVESGSIDFCFIVFVFQHIQSKKMIKNYIKEIFRVLKPDAHAKLNFRGLPGDAYGKVLWFHGFNSFFIALTLWRGWLPVPCIKRYNTLHGACFTVKELKKIFPNANIYHEGEKRIWVEF